MTKNLPALQNKSQIDLPAVVDRLRLTPETKKTYKFAMNSYRNYCKKHNKPSDLDSLLDWIESMPSPYTQATYIAAVKKVLTEVYKYDPRLIELKDNLEKIRPAKMTKTITESKYLKKDEINKMIEIANPKIGVIIETLFITGLRISELINLKHEDCVLLQNKKIYECRIIGKGRKENVVLIPVTLYKKITKNFEGINNSVYLFSHDSGKRYSREYLTREIKKVGEMIGRPEIHAHTIRHSAACYLRDERKLSLDKIQKFMNHSSMNTTASFYLHDRPTAEDLGLLEED